MAALAAPHHTDHRTHMLVRNVIKTIFCKVRRSGLFYLMIWDLPVRRASERETGWDALGVVVVVGLLAGLVGFMRYLLTS